MTTQLSYDAECHRKVTERRERYPRSTQQNKKEYNYVESGVRLGGLSRPL
jgi:hypothetical protein